MSLLLETTDSSLGKAYAMVSIGSQARQVHQCLSLLGLLSPVGLGLPVATTILGQRRETMISYVGAGQ